MSNLDELAKAASETNTDRPKRSRATTRRRPARKSKKYYWYNGEPVKVIKPHSQDCVLVTNGKREMVVPQRDLIVADEPFRAGSKITQNSLDRLAKGLVQIGVALTILGVIGVAIIVLIILVAG